MIDICNGPRMIENGLRNVCLAPAVPYLHLFRDVFAVSSLYAWYSAIASTLTISLESK